MPPKRVVTTKGASAPQGEPRASSSESETGSPSSPKRRYMEEEMGPTSAEKRLKARQNDAYGEHVHLSRESLVAVRAQDLPLARNLPPPPFLSPATKRADTARGELSLEEATTQRRSSLFSTSPVMSSSQRTPSSFTALSRSPSRSRSRGRGERQGSKHNHAGSGSESGDDDEGADSEDEDGGIDGEGEDDVDTEDHVAILRRAEALFKAGRARRGEPDQEKQLTPRGLRGGCGSTRKAQVSVSPAQRPSPTATPLPQPELFLCVASPATEPETATAKRTALATAAKQREEGTAKMRAASRKRAAAGAPVWTTQGPPSNEPKPEDPLEVHIKYHLEEQWGLSVAKLAPAGKVVGSVLAGWVVLALVVQPLLFALGGIRIPLPVVRPSSLLAALSDPVFGLPALFQLLFHGIRRSAGNMAFSFWSARPSLLPWRRSWSAVKSFARRLVHNNASPPGSWSSVWSSSFSFSPLVASFSPLLSPPDSSQRSHHAAVLSTFASSFYSSWFYAPTPTSLAFLYPLPTLLYGLVTGFIVVVVLLVAVFLVLVVPITVANGGASAKPIVRKKTKTTTKFSSVGKVLGEVGCCVLRAVPFVPHRWGMPWLRACQGLKSGLKTVRNRTIGGRPVEYLATQPSPSPPSSSLSSSSSSVLSSLRRGVSGGDKPTVLLLHDMFGCKEDWHDFVAELGSEFHVVCPDLPGHGTHQLGNSNGHGGRHALGTADFTALSVASEFLARFRCEVLGATKVHHVVGFGFGACVAMEYAQLESCADSVGSVSLLSPFALEPVSDDFEAFYGDPVTLVRHMANPEVVCKALLLKRTSGEWGGSESEDGDFRTAAANTRKRPVPSFYHRFLAAEWVKLGSVRLQQAKVLRRSHAQGLVYKQCELEASGKPIFVLFGSHDCLAKDFGAPVEVARLEVANPLLRGCVVERCGHDVLHESPLVRNKAAGVLSEWVLEHHHAIHKAMNTPF